MFCYFRKINNPVLGTVTFDRVNSDCTVDAILLQFSDFVFKIHWDVSSNVSFTHSLQAINRQKARTPIQVSDFIPHLFLYLADQ